MSTQPPGNAGGIHLEAVTKSFGTVAAVAGIDLVIAPGETVALLGPNGAGKSTTLDMVLGLLAPDTGRITLFGALPSDAVAAGHVVAMLQTGSLIQNLTVRELVDMVASLYPKPLAVDDALALAGLTELQGRWTQKLSGGETQRVRFACALVANADLLVLDEPTVALDVEARREFWAAVRNIAAHGATIIFATHYLEEAEAFADRIVLMAGGHIVADGSPTEITSIVGTRVIRATLPDVDLADLDRVVGVVSTERHGDTVALTCNDSDAALRSLLRTYDSMRNIEVRSGGLEQAFLELTSEAAR
ncbi:MAG: type transport system ATP-binding protein [Ilumatobacteraceae bacterium]|nr:type transport system ATP-binding protein [Ilumatobacteraceae bacterium]